MTEYEIRGELAASLKCWHRLTGEEAAELVAMYTRLSTVQQEAQEPVAEVIEELESDGDCWYAKVRWIFNPVPVGEILHWTNQPAEQTRKTIAEQALIKVLEAVRRYLPPDGPSEKDTLSEIISIVDPWPLDTPHPAHAPATPDGDELRRIARTARTSASDDASPTEYVLAGWRAAIAAQKGTK